MNSSPKITTLKDLLALEASALPATIASLDPKIRGAIIKEVRVKCMEAAQFAMFSSTGFMDKLSQGQIVHTQVSEIPDDQFTKALGGDEVASRLNAVADALAPYLEK